MSCMTFCDFTYHIFPSAFHQFQYVRCSAYNAFYFGHAWIVFYNPALKTEASFSLSVFFLYLSFFLLQPSFLAKWWETGSGMDMAKSSSLRCFRGLSWNCFLAPERGRGRGAPCISVLSYWSRRAVRQKVPVCYCLIGKGMVVGWREEAHHLDEYGCFVPVFGTFTPCWITVLTLPLP